MLTEDIAIFTLLPDTIFKSFSSSSPVVNSEKKLKLFFYNILKNPNLIFYFSFLNYCAFFFNMYEYLKKIKMSIQMLSTERLKENQVYTLDDCQALYML